MNNALMAQLNEAKRVLEKKEQLETQIFEENSRIHEHSIHLQMLESKMNLKRLNRKDRGRRLGRRFGIIGGLMIAAGIIATVSMMANGFSFYDAQACLWPALGFGGPPAIVSTCLLIAYFRGKPVRAAEAERVRLEYQNYLENKAKPSAESANLRIRELSARYDMFLNENESTLAFLPLNYRNVEAVKYMMTNVSQGKAEDIEQALQLCDKKNINRHYEDKICRREKELAKNYVVPGESSDGSMVGWMIFNGIIDIVTGN